MNLVWKYSFCHSCLRNAHREEKMVQRKIVSPNDETKFTELYVCTKCGSTRDI